MRYHRDDSHTALTLLYLDKAAEALAAAVTASRDFLSHAVSESDQCAVVHLSGNRLAGLRKQ